MTDRKDVQPSAPYDFELDKSPECLLQLRRFSGCFKDRHVLQHASVNEHTLQIISDSSPTHKVRCRCSFSFEECEETGQNSIERNTQNCDTQIEKQNLACTSGQSLVTFCDVIEQTRLTEACHDKTRTCDTTTTDKKWTKTSEKCNNKENESAKSHIDIQHEHAKQSNKKLRKRRVVKGIFIAAWVVFFPVMVVAVIARGSPGQDDEEDKHNDPLMPWYYRVHTRKS